ncbi:hypothetical protein SA0515718_01349 [Staphylococcus aureus]|nr:hypothetical protein SA2288_01337 [Staphylococcus aureus]QLH60635.1 hypothetical protein SA0515718_01349 [Staphylococcus aureus]QLH98322.1 hypothetical protein SA0759_01364 [Staphylococcus aureus]
MGPQFQQAMEVGDGAPTQKLTKSQISIMCKLGMGPNTENFVKKFYRQCELGINEFNFVKISFLSHSLCMSLIMYSYF